MTFNNINLYNSVFFDYIIRQNATPVTGVATVTLFAASDAEDTLQQHNCCTISPPCRIGNIVDCFKAIL